MAGRQNRVLTDHDEIRQWAESRGASPSCVRGTGGAEDVGMIRLDFPGYSGETSLQHIEWDEWLEKFDERGLALIVEDTTAGGQKSNFNKLVSRDTAKSGSGKRSGASSRKGAGTKRGATGRSGATKSAAERGSSGSSARKSSGGKRAGESGSRKSASSSKKTPAKKSSGKKSAGRSSAARKSSSARGAGKRAGGRGR